MKKGPPIENHSDIEEAREALGLLERDFLRRPDGRSGLHLEMKHVAARLESEDFPVSGLSLEDLSKQHAFLYISQEWAGYFLAVMTYKLVEKCMERDFSFIHDDVLGDYIFFFKDAGSLHQKVIRNLSDKQIRSLTECLWCFWNFMTPRVLSGKLDVLRELMRSTDVWQDAIDMK